MEVIYKPVSELIPAPYNPRRPLVETSSAYRKLKTSLERFGLVEPLLWNRRTGHLVSGHQRLRILQASASTPGQKPDAEPLEVPVVVVDLPLPEEQALNIVLNNREAQGQWDWEQLQDNLASLLRETPDIARASGFDTGEIEKLLAEFTPEDAAWQEPETREQVEIMFTVPRERFEELRPRFDALAGELGLEIQVRC